MSREDDFFRGTKGYRDKLIEFCKPIMDYMGVTHTIYVNVDKHGRMFSICTHPTWVERFLEEQYYLLDPLMVHPDNIHNGFSFDSSSDHQEFKDILLYDAVVKFNWCHSFAYIEKTAAGGYFGFDFGTRKDNHQIINRLIGESQIVKRFLRDLNKKLMRLAKRDIEDHAMDFAGLKGPVFHTQRGLVFKEECEHQQKIQLLQEVGFLKNEESNALLKASLSPQEINCLRTYLSTHSIKRVARDLDLAVTTVASYIENVKGKLNCNTKNELLDIAEILEALGRI